MQGNDLTFLLTDIEGSTRLWNEFPDEMLSVVAAHNEILQDVADLHGGRMFKDTGDGQWLSFDQAASALTAAVASQLQIAEHDWGPIGALRVRMGVHRGFTLRRGSDHCGQTVNLTARLNGIAQGGQVLATSKVVEAAQSDIKTVGVADISFSDLGEFRLRDLPDPVRVFEILHPAMAPCSTAPVAQVVGDQPALTESVRPLFGRDDDIQRLTELLQHNHLVTITGAAGIGKSRLAVRVANIARDKFSGGAILVDSPSQDRSGFLQDIASALGIYRQSSEPLLAIIAQYLQSQPTLLVLDGIEASTGTARDALAELHGDLGETRILATSTEALRLEVEQVYVLGPLSLSSEHGPSPAVQLLLETSSRFNDQIAPTADLPALTTLARAVDGVPLAIELLGFETATQSAHLLVQRFREVDTAAPLRTALASAVERLSEPAKDLLQEVVAMTGTFTLRTVAAVCASCTADSASELLIELHQHSLVARVRTDTVEVWFQLLQPIRRYVLDEMSERQQAEIQQRHAETIAASVVEWSSAARGRDELYWAEQIEGHFSDIGTAIDWSLENDRTDLAHQIISQLWDFAHTRMRAEIWGWADRILATDMPNPSPPNIMGVAALGAWMRGDGPEAKRLSYQAIAEEERLGLTPTIPARLALLDAQGYSSPGDTSEPNDLTWAIADLYHAASDEAPYWTVNVYVMGAIGLSFLGHTEAAQNLAGEGLALGRSSQNPSTLAWSLFGAAVAFESQDEPLAEAYADEAVRVARTVRNVWIEAVARGLLATLRRRVAGGRAAVPLLIESLAVWERSSHAAQQWHAVRASGFALLQEGKAELGLELIAAAQSASQAMPLLPSERAEVDAAVEGTDDSLDDIAKKRALARAKVLDLAEATRRARSTLLELQSS